MALSRTIRSGAVNGTVDVGLPAGFAELGTVALVRAVEAGAR